jgi:hypothetical protein
MFDDENQMICWFDTEVQAEAVGIPEGVLDEFMFSLGGPIAITERAYASAGQVKAVIIKDFGLDVTRSFSVDPLDSLQNFVRGFGFTLITRPRSGRSLDFNGGRYYSPTHDPKVH